MKFGPLANYFRMNPGVLFVVIFQVFLVLAAMLFVKGNLKGANEVAALSLYAIVMGVAVQVAIWARRETESA